MMVGLTDFEDAFDKSMHIFRLSKTKFAHPNDMWTGFYTKLILAPFTRVMLFKTCCFDGLQQRLAECQL